MRLNGATSAYAGSPGALRWLCGGVAVAVLVFLVASRDSVPIDHLDISRSYYDRRDVLISRWAEAPALNPFTSHPPVYSPEDKLKLGQWKNFDGLSCAPVADTPLVWTLKTPKAASSTLQDLILGLAASDPERFVVNTRQLRVDPSVTSKIPGRRELMLRRYAESFSSLRRRTVYTAHGWFVDLERGGSGPALGLPPPGFGGVAYRPVCIGTLRLPLPRLLSHYDYLHFGPRRSSRNPPGWLYFKADFPWHMLAVARVAGGEGVLPCLADTVEICVGRNAVQYLVAGKARRARGQGAQRWGHRRCWGLWDVWRQRRRRRGGAALW